MTKGAASGTATGAHERASCAEEHPYGSREANSRKTRPGKKPGEGALTGALQEARRGCLSVTIVSRQLTRILGSIAHLAVLKVSPAENRRSVLAVSSPGGAPGTRRAPDIEEIE